MNFTSYTPPEEKSQTKGNWAMIDARAPYSKKKIKCGPGRSKVFRHPGETVSLSPKTVARKQATADRIAQIKAGATRMRLMVQNPDSKFEKGKVVVQPRGEKGKFLKKVVLADFTSN